MADPILVIEDHKETLDAVQAIIKAEGYAVETADSGEGAIGKVTSKKYALVLLDIMLPRVDGFAVCKRIRSESKNMKTPVIMITALDIPKIGEKCVDAGADDFILKPFEPDELVAKVKKLLKA